MKTIITTLFHIALIPFYIIAFIVISILAIVFRCNKNLTTEFIEDQSVEDLQKFVETMDLWYIYTLNFIFGNDFLAKVKKEINYRSND